MEWIVGTVAIVAIALVAGVTLRRNAERRRIEEAARRERDAELAHLDAEAAVAPPLLDKFDGAEVNAVGRTVNQLLSEFGGLTTFQEVESWDSRAEKAAQEAEAAGRALSDFVAQCDAAAAAHRTASTEPHHIRAARIQKTKDMASRLRGAVAELAKAYEFLVERVEMTPNNKKDQAALLRELRAEKKELQAQKKGAKASAAAVRREARQLSANAGSSEFLGWPTYNSRVAAFERRAIRRAKEAALAPHEDAVQAIERRIATVDQRIAWVQRFGDDDV